MSVYGHNGAFEGLGKPSIRLEFETNEELVDFQRRMQGNDGGDNPDDGGSFTPGDKALDALSRLATNRPYLKVHTNEPDDIDDEEPAEWDGNKQEFETIEGYGDKYIVTDLRQRAKKEPGEVKNLTKFQFSKFKNAPELFEPVVSVSPSLFGVYPVFKGVNNDIVYFDKEFSDNYNADFILKDYIVNKSERLVTLNFARYKAYGTDGVSIVSVWSFSISCPVCNIITAYSSKIDAYFGLIEFVEGLIAVLKNAQSKLRANSKDYKTLQHQIERWQDAANQYADSLGAPGDTYIITDTRTRARKDLEDTAALKKYDIRKFSGEELQKMQTDDPLLYEQIKSDLQQQKTPIKKDVKTKEDWMQEVDKMLEAWKKEAFYKTTPQKLDEPASRVQARYLTNLRNEIIKYFIDEIDKGNYERVSNIANILGYKYAYNERVAQTNGLISQFVGIVPTLPDGWRISKNIPKYLPKLPKGFVYIDNGKEMFDYRHKIMPTQKDLGRTAPAALYNNNAIMDCKGMRPTYRQLPDYSAFFAPANSAETLAGSGLPDTMHLIADTCKAHYKDCAKIAQHLKGDCKLQSAFNVWHWMRNNIRYEYDSEGREEVRTPLRTWQDRRRGVDCDCLSVFAWCTLYNMGYNPLFELAAFNHKPNYSHIYLNLDGIIIDRVWYVWNTRPPQVTSIARFGVDMQNDLIGKMF